MKLEGMKQLKKAFAELPKAVQPRVVRKTLKEAAQPVADRANALAPKDLGNLSRSYRVSSKLTQSQRRQLGQQGRGEIKMYIGPNYQKGTTGYAPHAHLVEFGTIDRYHKDGRYVGHAPAQPHFRPAWESGKQMVVNSITVSFDNQIQREAERLARKATPKKR